MSNFRKWPFFLAMLFLIGATAPACSKKTGCPAESSLKTPQKNKKKHQSGLMPKKMSKKVSG